MIFAIIAWFIIGYCVWVLFCTKQELFDQYSDIDFVAMMGVVASWLWPVWLIALLLKVITKKIVAYLVDKEFKDV